MSLNYLQMNKIYSCLAILLLLAGQSFSQQLISTAGQEQNNVSWSIGELATEASTASGLMVYQGFNCLDGSVVSGLSEISLSGLTAYPNPVIDKLFLKLSQEGLYSFTLSDILGRVLLKKATDSDQEIDLSHYEAGQYMLKVTSNQLSKTTIIIKK